SPADAACERKLILAHLHRFATTADQRTEGGRGIRSPPLERAVVCRRFHKHTPCSRAGIVCLKGQNSMKMYPLGNVARGWPRLSAEGHPSGTWKRKWPSGVLSHRKLAASGVSIVLM